MTEPTYPVGERGAFNVEAGLSYTLPSRYYHDPEIHRRELTAIFHRSWCYVGHARQLAEPGDFRVDRIADQCIFLVRNDATTISAFFNACQHRGHQLLHDSGNTGKRIVCPYHAWTYRLDGRLARAPHTDAMAAFDPSEFGLREVRLANCRGLLFANLSADAPDFEIEYAGLGDTFDRYLPALIEFDRSHHLQYDIAANWKVVVDNFSEGYHIPVVHQQLSQVFDCRRNKHAIVHERYACFESISKTGYAGFELEAGEPYLSWTIWPNTCLLSLPGCDNLIVLRMAPYGPTRCLERVDLLARPGEPVAKLDAIRKLFAGNFNLEDIALVENVQRGLQSLGYDQGRYVADDRDAWYSESGLHRFHRSILDALRAAD